MTTSTPTPQQPKKSWLAAHHVLGYLFVFAVLAAIVSVIYYEQTVSQIPNTPPIAPVTHGNTPTSSTPAVDTSNWQTYTDAKNGFSFQYPPTLIEKDTTAEGATTSGFYETQDQYSQGLAPTFNFTLDQLPAQGTLTDWIKSFGVASSSISPVKLGNNSYTSWAADGTQGADAFISYSIVLNGNQILTFTTTMSFASNPEFTQALATLKFTN